MLMYTKWCVCLIIFIPALLPFPCSEQAFRPLYMYSLVYSFYFLQSHMFLAVIAVTTKWLTLS